MYAIIRCHTNTNEISFISVRNKFFMQLNGSSIYPRMCICIPSFDFIFRKKMYTHSELKKKLFDARAVSFTQD